MIPQHQSISNEHATPIDFLEAEHRVMGGIDLDVASCAIANQQVKATSFFTKEDDGLSRNWYGRVHCNPPGGKLRWDNEAMRWVPVPSKGSGESSARVWWESMHKRWLGGQFEQGIFVGFNTNLLAIAPSIWEFPICMVTNEAATSFVSGGRIKYEVIEEDGIRGSKAPPHASFFVYLPPPSRIVYPRDYATREESIARFEHEFSIFGRVGTLRRAAA